MQIGCTLDDWVISLAGLFVAATIIRDFVSGPGGQKHDIVSSNLSATLIMFIYVMS